MVQRQECTCWMLGSVLDGGEKAEGVNVGKGEGGRNHTLELLSIRYDHLFICVCCVLGFKWLQECQYLCEIP